MFDQATATAAFETTDTPAQVNGPNTLAQAFIQRLATDDSFRAETVTDPVAAAAKYGFVVESRLLPEGGITLPSKEVLSEHLDTIASRFAAASRVIVVFQL